MKCFSVINSLLTRMNTACVVADRIVSSGTMRIPMKNLLTWSPLRPLISYLQERFTFLVLLCWPAIIWVVCRGCVWAIESALLLMGKPLSESFTVHLQPLMTFSALVRISLSWVALLFILFSMAMGFTWLLRRVMNRKP